MVEKHMEQRNAQFITFLYNENNDLSTKHSESYRPTSCCVHVYSQRLQPMLKSEQNGCYRITLVLPSHDYLSISPTNTHHILVPTHPHPLPALHLPTRPHQLKSLKIQQHVLTPKQCIEVDNVKYLVINIEGGEVQTGLKMKAVSKRLACKVFRQSVRDILEQILWLEAKDVKQYLDIRNFIMVGETMYLMLVQRSKPRTTSLPRSEKRFSLPVSSLQTVLDNELLIIRQFGLLLWEILHQKVYRKVNENQRNQAKQSDVDEWIDVLLEQMISKKATMEYINRVLDENVEERRNRVKTRVVSRSEERPVNYSADSKGFQRGGTIEICRKRYSILENSRKINETTYSKRTNLHSRFNTQPNDQSSLKRQKSSLMSLSAQLRSSYKQSTVNPKLERQNIQALQKFNRAVSKPQVESKQYKIDDQKLKIKLIDRLKKLKLNAHTQIERNIHERVEDGHKGNEKIQAVTRKLQFEEEHKMPIKQEESQKEVVKVEDTVIVDITKDVKLQQPILIERNTQKPTLKRQNNFIHNMSSNASLVQNPSVVGNIGNLSIKTSVSKSMSIADNPSLQSGPNLKFSQSKDHKKISALNPHDDQIEEIVLKRDNESKPQPTIKEIHKRQSTPPSQPLNKQEKHKEIKPPTQSSQSLQSPKQKSVDLIPFIDQYLNMINILGTLSVKAFKSKQKLSKIEWEKPIYFLYERFYHERNKLLQSYKQNSRQIIRKRTLKIPESQWQSWLISSKRQELIAQLTNENHRILNDLNKFAQKLLKTAKLQRKMELYIRKRQHYMGLSSKRIELSRFAVMCVLDQYDSIVTHRLNNKDIIDHMLDCLFGLQIVAELDDLAPPAVRPKLEQYQDYLYDLKASNDLIEILYSLYVEPEQA